MEQKKIKRINQLARKAKASGLSEDERLEQAELRAEYLRTVRSNMRAQLEQIRVVEADGIAHPLKKKKDKF